MWSRSRCRLSPAARYDILAFSGTRATGQRTPARSTPQGAGGPLHRLAYRTMTAGREGGAVGSAARRGPGFTLGEPGPFPGSLPPNPACTFQCTGLSRDLCRVRDGAALAENAQYHFGFLHFAYLMVPIRSSPVPLHPVVRY